MPFGRIPGGVNGLTMAEPRGPRVYYVISALESADTPAYVVWERSSGRPEAIKLGEFPTVEAARASLPVRWRDAASPFLVAWAIAERPGSTRARRPADEAGLEQVPERATQVTRARAARSGA